MLWNWKKSSGSGSGEEPAENFKPVQQNSAPAQQSSNAVSVDLRGNAVFPKGAAEVRRRAFYGNRSLQRAIVPASVEKICEDAFASCTNLKRLELPEGLKNIETSAFTGCASLEKLTIPDSVTDLCGWAFYQAEGLQKPVFNRSGNILYHYPNQSREEVFAVPEGVERIHDDAFLRHPTLKEVILPRSLKRIDPSAFLECEIQCITIPESVEKVCKEAFYGCKKLEKVTVLCDLSAIETNAFAWCGDVAFYIAEGEVPYAESLRFRGYDFLQIPRGLMPPENDSWQTGRFRKLAEKSCRGDAGAMLEFAEFFDGLEEHPFFRCAANFWRYRAAKYGNPEAKRWLREWMEAHPRERMPGAFLSNFHSSAGGNRLHSLGFLFFDPDRSYYIGEPDANGVVEVSSWSDSDGPDEDGYGREENYDWWYLDEHLQPIPGLPMIHSFSNHDRRYNESRFTQLREQAAQILRSINK